MGAKRAITVNMVFCRNKEAPVVGPDESFFSVMFKVGRIVQV